MGTYYSYGGVIWDDIPAGDGTRGKELSPFDEPLSHF